MVSEKEWLIATAARFFQEEEQKEERDSLTNLKGTI